MKDKMKTKKKNLNLTDLPVAGAEFFNHLRARHKWVHEDTRMPSASKRGRPHKISTLRPGEVVEVNGEIYFRDTEFGLVKHVYAKQVINNRVQVDTVFAKPMPSRAETEKLMLQQACVARDIALRESVASDQLKLADAVQDVIEYPIGGIYRDPLPATPDEIVPYRMTRWLRFKCFFAEIARMFTN